MMKKLIYFLICYWIRWHSFWEPYEYPILGRTNVRRFLGKRNLFNTNYCIWEFTAKMKSGFAIQQFVRQLEKDLWGTTFATSWNEKSNLVSVPAPWRIRERVREAKAIKKKIVCAACGKNHSDYSCLWI